MKYNTLFVNLFNGPGVSKSTTAASTFSNLKKAGYNAEIITEYAKQKTWLLDRKTLLCQPYVTAKQLYKQYIVNEEVEVAVTDSPILLGLVYPGFGISPAWKEGVVHQFNEFRNLNFLITRNSKLHPYNPKGRSQTEEEAIAKDAEIAAMLNHFKVPYIALSSVSHDDNEQVIFKVIQSLLSVEERPIDFTIVDKTSDTLVNTYTDHESARIRLTDLLQDSDNEGRYEIVLNALKGLKEI